MNYRSVADLNEGILKWIPSLPRDLDLIVGIPRSGMLAANLLALHLNLPMTDLEGFADGRLFMAGDRCRIEDRKGFLRQCRNVLVVDDSVLLGTQVARARQRIRHLQGKHRIQLAAVYVQPGMEHLLDFHCELLERPRVFEWHLMHHPNLRLWCVDIDGVLCSDPREAENDDAEKYLGFLRTVEPTVVPSKEIGLLVTCRLEKYRDETERWLHKHGIRYRHLIMMDYPDMNSRRAANNYASFKAGIYRKSNAPLFIESSRRQALAIASLSGKSVFCFETREMIQPGILPRTLHQPRTTIRDLVRLPKVGIKRLLGSLLKG